MRPGFLSAAVLAVALAVPADSFARQNGGPGPSAGMRGYASRAPLNPPRFVKSGPYKAAGFHRAHRHSMRGHHHHGHYHAHGHRHRHALRFGLGYLGSYYPAYAYAPYVYDDAYVSSPYVYDDPQTTYAQNPQETYQRVTPAGQCWTQSVQVSSDRSRDVRITRC